MQVAPQFQQFPAAQPLRIEPLPPSSRFASRTLIGVGAVGAVVAALTWRAGPGLGWAVADAILVAAVLVGIHMSAGAAGPATRRPSAPEWILGAASVWLAWMTCWRASDWALVTALPASGVALMALGLVAARRIRAERLDELGRATLEAVRELPAGLVAAAKMPAVALDMKARSRALQIVRGVLVGLPLAAFFVLLLLADNAFAKLLARLVVRTGDGIELAVWTGATTAALLLACVILQRLQARSYAHTLACEGAAPYRFEGDLPLVVSPLAAPKPRVRVLTWGVVLLQLVGVFAIYVVANAKSLFVGHDVLRAHGTWTYSQYLHEGFFQVAVATFFAVACVVIGHALLRAPGGAGKPLPGGKALAAVELTLLGLVGVTLASSVHRLALYEEAYGYTELRLAVRLAQLGVAGLIALTAARCLLRAWRGWGAAFAWSVVVFTVGVSSMNADAWIARRNVARARAGLDLDAAHLASLSEDASVVLGDLKGDAEAQFLAGTWWASRAANHGRDWRSWRGLGSR
jgi:hypothetical protein